MELIKSGSRRAMISDPQEAVGSPRWRLHRFWLEDGLQEMIGGGVCLVFAAFDSFVRQEPFSFLGLAPLVFVAWWLYFRTLYGLKGRFVDRRVGFVRPRMFLWFVRLSGRFWVGVAVACALIAALLGALDVRPWHRSPIEIGLFIVQLLLPTVFAIVPAAVVGAASLTGAGWLLVRGLWLAAFGLTAVVAGGLAFRAFLRANPDPHPDAPDLLAPTGPPRPSSAEGARIAE